VDIIESSSTAMYLVRGLIMLCEELDIEVIAEGVETPEQQQLLKDMGCMHMQGFVFGHPVEASDVTKYIHSYTG
jgi:EAL domain-containing protein (putative c-di-GMP-specific phosphodiesterase class I)